MKTYLFLLCFSMLALAGHAQTQAVVANRDIEPVPINLDSVKRAIGYPILAKEAEIQGDVIAYILVDSTGSTIEHFLLYSCHPILGKAVDAQLSRLRFTPGKIDGAHGAFWITIPFKFRQLGGKTDRLSEPADGGFFLISEGVKKQIEDPFGKSHADILKQVRKNKANGKPVKGSAYFWVEFDAQGKRKIFSAVANGNPEIQNLVKKEIARLSIPADSPLLRRNSSFMVFVPFVIN
jgi:Gram-negative bacterial TonB protein C-terminal